MGDITIFSPPAPIWVSIISVLQVLLFLWLGFILLLGSWKLFRFLIKWKPLDRKEKSR